MSVRINTRELKRLEKSFGKAGKTFDQGADRLLKKLGVWVQGRAKERAPESPTLGMYARQNKSGKSKRKHLSTGSLRDSIEMEQGKMKVEIGIPANSRAKDYAKKMHDEKGKTWNEFGPRSKQKPLVSDKFIYRAEKDSKRVQKELLDDVINEVSGDIGA